MTSETIEESVDSEILEFPDVIIQTIKDVNNQVEKEANFSIDVDIDNLARDMDSKKKDLTSEDLILTVEIDLENRDKKGMNVLVSIKTNGDSLENNKVIIKSDFEAEEEILKLLNLLKTQLF